VNNFKLKRVPVAVCLAAILVLAGCHKKTIAPAPPTTPPPPPPPAPTASISVSPAAINPGQSATLFWSTTNATNATIEGIGPVAVSGSQSVSPSTSTIFTITAKGAGGSVDASTRITVNPPPPPPPAPVASLTDEQLFDQNVQDVYFDYDVSDLRTQDVSVAQNDASFLLKHPGMNIVIGGYCDERGSAEYNIALGQRRAESLRKALVDDGVPGSRIRVVSYGKEKPFCTESTEQCWQQNRRDHLVLDR
jgi:peptidoglycan-associated lipoprotein